MILHELELAGVYRIELERYEDERGALARTFSADELASEGLESRVAQISTSFNRQRGTLRGLHLQVPPHEETKIVRCTQGAVYDVVLDLRSESSSFGRWLSQELSAGDDSALYVPRGCAHGFLTLTDAATLDYVFSTPYEANAATGVRWDDPAIGVQWPFEPTVMSRADATRSLIDIDRIREEGIEVLTHRAP